LLKSTLDLEAEQRYQAPLRMILLPASGNQVALAPETLKQHPIQLTETMDAFSASRKLAEVHLQACMAVPSEVQKTAVAMRWWCCCSWAEMGHCAAKSICRGSRLDWERAVRMPDCRITSKQATAEDMVPAPHPLLNTWVFPSSPGSPSPSRAHRRS